MTLEREKDSLVRQYINDRVLSLQGRNDSRINKQTLDLLAKHELFLRREEKLAEKFAQRSWIPTYKGKKTKYVERKLNLLISDTHYGADLDPRLVQYPYGPVEESRRTASVGAQVADYKRQYRPQTTLNVHILGDIISGKLHDVQNGANLTEQIDRALHHNIHLLEFLATEFREVNVRTSVGNHGRDTSRHQDRVMQDKFDSHEFRLYRAIKWAMKKVPNVKMEVPMRGYYVVDQFGMKSMFTHGDTILQPGYPGKSINTGKLKTQANEFCLSAPEYKDTKLFAVGHVHQSTSTQAGSATIVTNGCLLPGDEFSQSIGIFGSTCSQWLWETVDGHIFGDSRRLEVGPDQDKDVSLDKIIPLWEGLES
jgi:hypothetical protein